jgi:hypothetical protein
MHIEKRRWPRVEINASGKLILITDGLRIKQSVKCAIIDVSQGGALIDAHSTVSDLEFYLEIDTDPGRLLLCSVVRRLNDRRMGVRFIEAELPG